MRPVWEPRKADVMTNTQTHLDAPFRPHAGNVVAPAVAGIAAIAMAVYQVATPGTPHATFDSFSDWLRESLFLTYLLASIAGLAMTRRDGITAKIPTWMVQAGYGLIAVGAAAGMILRDDPDWFFVLAGPGLLLSTIGFIWLAINALRRRTLPLWAAALAGFGGAVAILMAELGTSVLIGAFWLYVASHGRLD
jgi:hypothetical protein